MLSPLRAADLTIQVDAAPADAVRLHWLGKSTDREPARVLLPFFLEALTLAAQNGRKLELHFEKLEHFNSSTIGALIQLMHRAREKKVPLVFVYDGRLTWQQLSFDALQRIAGVFASLVYGLEFRTVAHE